MGGSADQSTPTPCDAAGRVLPTKPRMYSTKMNTTLRNILALAASAIALLCAPALRAQVLTFNVDISTAGLSADSANAPLFLDFNLHYGNSALSSNNVVLSNFTFTGGSAIGSPVLTGSATGSTASSVTLTASSANPNADFYQQFSAGVTDIKFTAKVTESGPHVGAPTEFTTAIFDSSLGSPAQLYTTAPDTMSLLILDLNASNTIANVQTYSAFASADGNTSLAGVQALAAIPEPSTTAAMCGGVAMMFAFCARRFRRVQTA